MSIRWKLILAIGVPFIVLSLAGLALDFFVQRRAAFQQTEIHLKDLVERSADQLDGQFSTIAQAARSMATALEANPDFTEPQLYAMMRGNVAQNSLIYGSCIAFVPYGHRPDRELLAPYVYRNQGAIADLDIATVYNYTDAEWEWFDRPRRTQRDGWTEPYFDEGAGNVIMCTYSAPFFRDGQFRGVVTVDVELDKLQGRMIDKPASSALFMILSRRGMVISDEDESLIMRTSIFQIAQEKQRPDLEALGTRLAAGERGLKRMQGITRAGPVLAAFAPIPSTGWSFLARVGEREIMAPIYRQLALRTALAVALLGLILAVLIFMSVRITRPIERLADAARQLGGGDLEMKTVDIHGGDEVGELADAFNRMVKDLRKHVEALTDATARRERVESELRVARNIQTSLLPHIFPPFPQRPEFALHADNAPARHVAGDFFDFFFVDETNLVFVIADVSGKGVPAAMYMAVTRTLLRNQAGVTRSPAQMLTAVNQTLVPSNEQSMFVTMFVGCYDIRSGVLHYANAGHPQPYLVDDGGRVSLFGDVTGPLVGIFPDEQYQEASVELAPGARLVLYTDGVTEAKIAGGELFGSERLATLLTGIAGESVERMCQLTVQEIQRYQNGDLSDDVTLLVLQRTR